MLRITGLSKTYANGVQALADVSLEIPTGMFGLLGPNGAGKSTLMRTIATLQEADTGSVHFGGIDALRDKEGLRRSLGYLPQEFGSYPRTSTEVMLNHLAILKGISAKAERKELVERLLVQANLWELRKTNIDSFSGGMKQRFGIAQALIGDPKLIIVDEPTAGLDPAERRRFHNLLIEIGEQVVVILSTHIVDDVSELCPRMAIMGAGKILVTGEPQALTDRLSGRLWCRRMKRAEIAPLMEALSVISTRMVAGDTELRAVGDTCPAPGFEPAEPTLEDVYFNTLDQHDIDVNLG